MVCPGFWFRISLGNQIARTHTRTKRNEMISRLDSAPTSDIQQQHICVYFITILSLGYRDHASAFGAQDSSCSACGMVLMNSLCLYCNGIRKPRPQCQELPTDWKMIGR